MLIDHCVCGGRAGRLLHRNDGLIAMRCHCGTAWLLTDRTAETIADQYRGEYHASTTRHPSCRPYADRYTHDRQIAAVRWDRYVQVWQAAQRTVRWVPSLVALDVGAANGAFVDALRALGVEAWGVDPDPTMKREHVFTGTLENVVVGDGDYPETLLGVYWDLITMHDVLEHMVQPDEAVAMARTVMRPGALLVVDVPDVWNGGGEHHWKAEHLWYFSASTLTRLITRAGFDILAEDRPIPGKLVLHAEAR